MHIHTRFLVCAEPDPALDKINSKDFSEPRREMTPVFGLKWSERIAYREWVPGWVVHVRFADQIGGSRSSWCGFQSRAEAGDRCFDSRL